MRTIAYLVAATTALAFTAPTTALAYRTYADDRGLAVPMAREQATVQVLVRGASVPGFSAEELAQVVGDAALAWRSECSPIEVMLLGASDREPSPFDGLTSVVVLTEGWEARGYAPNQAGVADLFLVDLPDRLAIRDADVFINADTVDWTAPDAPDLRAILQHELGHALLGLGHVCGDSGAPACTDELRATSIMAPDYQVGRTSRARTISSARAVCSCPRVARRRAVTQANTATGQAA